MTSKPETIIQQIKELSKDHSELLIEFKDWLTDEENSSLCNATNYLRVLKLFSEHIGLKDLKKITKEDIITFLDKRKKPIETDPDKRWERTWNDYLARLVGFYRWLHNKETDISREDWNTPEPFNIIKKKKNKRHSSYSPNDVWSQEELLLAVKYCDNLRDKTIFTMSWDMASRNHEIVKMRIRDIILKEKYAEASTAWDTKTGTRTNPIIIGFPYLRDLLNVHPFSSDPNAFLFISRTTLKPLNPDSLWRIADTLKKRITKMIKDEKIKSDDKDKIVKLLQKPWNPYLLGRHSSLTEKTDMLNDFQLKQYAGWQINSTRPRTYVHRKGKQVINPLLAEYGITPKQERKITRKECSKCGYINTIEASLCSKCSFILDVRAWENTKLEEQQEKKELTLTLTAMQKKIEVMEQNQADEQKRFEQWYHYMEEQKRQQLEDELKRRKIF